MKERLNNSILALSRNISEQNKNIFWDLNEIYGLFLKNSCILEQLINQSNIIELLHLGTAGFRLVNRTEPPLRTCGRVEGRAGCTSTTYSTYGVEYSKVCDRIIAYQNGSPDGFTPELHLY